MVSLVDELLDGHGTHAGRPVSIINDCERWSRAGYRLEYHEPCLAGAPHFSSGHECSTWMREISREGAGGKCLVHPTAAPGLTCQSAADRLSRAQRRVSVVSVAGPSAVLADAEHGPMSSEMASRERLPQFAAPSVIAAVGARMHLNHSTETVAVHTDRLQHPLHQSEPQLSLAHRGLLLTSKLTPSLSLFSLRRITAKSHRQCIT